MKIIRKAKSLLIYSLIAVILMLAGLYIYGGNVHERLPDFSTYSYKKEGTKALYILTDKMGYTVARYERPAKFLPDNVILVVIEPQEDRFTTDTEIKCLKDWVGRGNTLIFIRDNPRNDKNGLLKILPEKPKVIREFESGTEFAANKGKVVLIENARGVTNDGLSQVRPGIVFIDALDKTTVKKVWFNEFYHGFGSETTTVWDLLGQNGMLIVTQIFIAMLLILFINARRFGKPTVVFEIIKREENENLFALSNIYIKAKANHLVLESQFLLLKKELSKFLGFNYVAEDSMIIHEASKSKVLSNLNIKELFNSCYYFLNNDVKDKKQMVKLVKMMEIIKRRIR